MITMRTGVKILVIVFFFIAFLWGMPYLFFHYSGKFILLQQLKAHTNKEVTVGAFFVRFPLTLEVRDLHIPEVISVKSATVIPDMVSLLAGKVVLKKVRLVKPVIYHSRGIPPSVLSPEEINAPSEETLKAVKPQTAAGNYAPPVEEPRVQVIIRHLGIQDGILHFTDYHVKEEGLKLTLTDVSIGLDNFYTYPYSAITTFGVRANIPWHERDKTGVLRTEGWINFFKKDMQAKLKVENIDGIYLEPYYNNYVDFEQARIEDATLRFHCTIQGLENDATVRGEFELTDIVRVPRPEDEYRQPAERLTDTLLVLFQSLDEEGRIKLPIEYDTTLDEPEFGFGIFKAAFVDTVMTAREQRALKPERVLGFPGKLMTGVFKGVGDLTKAVLVGSVTVADGVRQGVTASFRKNAPPPNPEFP